MLGKKKLEKLNIKFYDKKLLTFFPDNWDKERIIKEVEYAVKNNRGKIKATSVAFLIIQMIE
jgi:hypothetical protein